MIITMNGQKMTQMLEIEKKLIARIPKGYGRYISCNEGWYKILEEIDNKLSYLDPNYRVAQIKEKFGTLRFYFDTDAEGLIRDIMYDCVRAGEYASSYTCEYCGSPQGRLQDAGWVKTACHPCWNKKEDERANRMEALDELIKFNEENGLYDIPLSDELKLIQDELPLENKD